MLTRRSTRVAIAGSFSITAAACFAEPSGELKMFVISVSTVGMVGMFTVPSMRSSSSAEVVIMARRLFRRADAWT